MSTDTVKTKKHGLGRGLDSLIPASHLSSQQVSTPRQTGVMEVEIDLLFCSKNQPRKKFDREKLEGLADSIKAQGIIQPILVYKKEGKYEIVAGERRFRAANIAGLAKVPVILKDLDPSKAQQVAIVENIQREDLNPIEEADAYKSLVEDHGLTHSKIAKLVGKDRATISNLLRIQALSSKVKDCIRNGSISLGHAKVLASVLDLASQNRYAGILVKKKLSVRGLERLIKNPKKSSKDDRTLKLVSRIATRLEKKLKTKVNIDYKNEKGSVSIYYYSSEQFNDLIEKLEKLDGIK